MPEVNNSKKKVVAQGADSILASPNCSHHNIAIEGATSNSFTIKCKVKGLSTLMTFDGNSISNNAMAVFILPGIESFEITPSDLAAAYTVQVHSF